MANLFVDLEEDSTAKWLNLAANTGGLMPYLGSSFAQPGLQTNQQSASNDNKGNTGNTYSPPISVTCYECNNSGVLVPSSYLGSTCPPGTSPNPNYNCDDTKFGTLDTGNMVSCTKCDGGSPIMNMFSNQCPEGWLPEFADADGKIPIDPCTEIDCWDCETGSKQRVPNGVACSSDTALRVPVINNSSSNPCVNIGPERDCWDCETGSKQRVPNGVACSSDTALRVPVINNSSSNPCVNIGPERDCWNCTTGAVTRIVDGEPCPGDDSDAKYLVDLKANGSSDNPCKEYSNFCYRCTDGVVESQIYQSDIEAECPDGWTQDRKPCREEEMEDTEVEITESDTPSTTQAGFLGKNTKYLTFGIIVLGAIMLMKKK